MGGVAADGLWNRAVWNWAVGAHLDAGEVRAAVAAAVSHDVTELGSAPADAVMCDVYHVGGDYPTLVDCYLVPAAVVEGEVAAAVAVRLGAAVLLPDDTLNPTRYVRAEPDGSRTTVHVDEIETDDGPERRHTRPCTGSDPACAAAPERHAA